MSLYRIDFASGQSVSDILGPCLFRRAQAARERAIGESILSGKTLTVVRISGAGSVRAMYTVTEGKVSRCN